MKEKTRNRKRSKRKVLHELQQEARFNIWQLGKWGYSVNIESLADSNSRKEMNWREIYSYENFWVHENGKCILRGCSYSELQDFTKLVKRYKHNYGDKKLHSYTDEILAKI